MKKEIDIENKDVFIKLEPDNSMDIKKALLEIEAASINMQLVAERLKEKARQELSERALARRHLKEASNMIYDLVERLPKPKEAIKKPEVIGKETAEAITKMPKKEQSYSRQLEDIKRKIASL